MDRILVVLVFAADLVLLNILWLRGGRLVAARLGFRGPWAAYKGQLIIGIPVLCIAMNIAFYLIPLRY